MGKASWLVCGESGKGLMVSLCEALQGNIVRGNSGVYELVSSVTKTFHRNIHIALYDTHASVLVSLNISYTFQHILFTQSLQACLSVYA